MCASKHPLKLTLITLPIVILIYAALFIWFDKPIAHFAHTQFANTHLFKICDTIGNIFKSSHWAALAALSAIIGFGLWCLKKKEQARPFIYYFLCFFVAAIIANLLKQGLSRARPIELFEHQKYGFYYLQHLYNFASTPSGHATFAFSSLLALSYIFKKCWFVALSIIIATLISVSRVVIIKHFVGDIVLGAYIGTLSVLWVYYLFPPHKKK